jgi:hypothetical protein
MPRANERWIHTAKTDCAPEFSASHIIKRTIYNKKVYLEFYYLN